MDGPPHRRMYRTTVSRLALVAVASMTLPTCQSAPSEPDPAAGLLPYLMGEWAWECSTGGFSGETFCAATSGYTQTWEFGTDSVFRWMRSDTMVITAPFRIVRHGPGITGDSINLLLLNGFAPLIALAMPTQDRLVATEQCYDCYTSTWDRTR
jgi:hypothetical protein